MTFSSQLKRAFYQLASFFDSYARARAAAELASHGHHEAANRLMNDKSVSK